MKKFIRRLIRITIWLTLMAVLAVALLVWVGWWYAQQPLKVRGGGTEFTVPRGMAMRQAANVIRNSGVAADPRFLSTLARLSGRAQQIKAGTYRVEAGITPWDLIIKLELGDVARGTVLLVEGWTFRQMRAALEKHPDLLQDTSDLSDDEILARVGASQKQPEGLFFPDTYVVTKGDSALSVFSRAYQAMQKRLDREWEDKALDLPLKSPYDALILASIVEKETGRHEDRTRVANVFINRLRVGMKLQTDPTVIYGMGEKYDGKLRRSNLEADTPWNTYIRTGLPPTPIAMPGRASLRAALHPEGGDMLYFVACGNGSSVFSRTLGEHNKAVDRCLRKKGTSKS
ncbi:MAG: endolytic transglycosylase MltG [Betaproteobacteria bacterium]|nr:endolytic transglycosylase MltG [Betaproteobacteria bacterium]